MSEIHAIRHKGDRQLTLEVARIIAKEEGKSVFGVWLRMMRSLIFTGATFKEYYNLDFTHRTFKNQKTFITTGSNLKAYGKLNDKSLYHLYINKDEFNNRYRDFIARDWINLSSSREEIRAFFASHDGIIIKPKDGDSGKGITVVRDSNRLTDAEIDEITDKNRSGIAEQLLSNHPRLNELNPTSLNTMRVITVRDGDKARILFAGIRFGAKGCEIDNISKGGHIAPIDIESGRIFARSHTKKSVTQDSAECDHIGFEIPMWSELSGYLDRLSAVVPEMRYMAWDIATTQDGFAVIEGNHSSGNTVIQAHLGRDEQGLRVKLEQIIRNMKK